MGGKLLKLWDLPEKRLDMDEYHPYAKQLIGEIRAIIAEVNTPDEPRYQVIGTYEEKASFGDIDVLCESSSSVNWMDVAKVLSDTGTVHKNTNVYSFPRNRFQVDLIIKSSKYYDFASKYYYGSDLGNLIGRVAHKFGLSFGCEGLKYILREELFDPEIKENSHVLEEVDLTTNFYEAIKFLGFDADRYRQGFKNLNEIFEYVASSKYFNPDIYLLDNLNHKQRVRDAKRATYNAFLEWCEENRYRFTGVTFSRKRDYLPWLCQEFPVLSSVLHDHASSFYFKREYKKRLNGRIVGDVLGTEDGKQIGGIMSKMKLKYPAPLIVAMRDEWIKEKILEINEN